MLDSPCILRPGVAAIPEQMAPRCAPHVSAPAVPGPRPPPPAVMPAPPAVSTSCTTSGTGSKRASGADTSSAATYGVQHALVH